MKEISFVTNELEGSHLYLPADKKNAGLCRRLAESDFLIIPSVDVREFLGAYDGVLSEFEDFQASFDRLEQDQYMRDGGKYRFRRHAVYSSTSAQLVTSEPHQPHYQSVEYNALNGGAARHFAAIEPHIASGNFLKIILKLCRSIFGGLSPFYSWHIEVHQFRIVVADTVSLPTPEGIHRDGVSFVFMMLINRLNVLHGVTSIYNRERKEIARHTLVAPFDVVIVNDERTLHGVTPIQADNIGQQGYRDMLVITFNKR